MKIVFRTKNGKLYLNEKKSCFEHSEEKHKINPISKHRMLEETHQDFIQLNKRHGNVTEFKSSHTDLDGYPIKLLYKERTKVNRQLNSTEHIIAEL